MLAEFVLELREVGRPQRHRPAPRDTVRRVREPHEPLALRRLEQLYLRREPLLARALREGQLFHDLRRTPWCRRLCHGDDRTQEGITHLSRLRAESMSRTLRALAHAPRIDVQIVDPPAAAAAADRRDLHARRSRADERNDDV